MRRPPSARPTIWCVSNRAGPGLRRRPEPLVQRAPLPRGPHPREARCSARARFRAPHPGPRDDAADGRSISGGPQLAPGARHRAMGVASSPARDNAPSLLRRRHASSAMRSPVPPLGPGYRALHINELGVGLFALAGRHRIVVAGPRAIRPVRAVPRARSSVPLGRHAASSSDVSGQGLSVGRWRSDGGWPETRYCAPAPARSRIHCP